MSQEQVEELVRRNGHIKSMDFDPVTRVAERSAFHAVADFKERRIVEARSVATLFRGYEVIMVGRDPRDAIYITSRACGVCGGVHSTCSALAIEMAIGCVPPPLGVLTSGTLRSHWSSSTTIRCTFTCLPGPITQPLSSNRRIRRFTRAQRKPKLRTGTSMATANIGALMEDLNPLSGKLYVEALHMTRLAREAYVLICGKYPHPQTIVPGGMSSTITLTVMNEMFVRLAQFFDYSKKIAGIWDDLTEFFL